MGYFENQKLTDVVKSETDDELDESLENENPDDPESEKTLLPDDPPPHPGDNRFLWPL